MVRPSEWRTEVCFHYCIPTGFSIYFLLAWDGLALYLHSTQDKDSRLSQVLLKSSQVLCAMLM